jgi:hypothetical protein
MKGKMKIRKLKSDETTYSSDSDSTYTETDTSVLENKKKAGWKSISSTKYRKPATGSRQDNLTREEIEEKLEGYMKVRTMTQLKELTPFKTWVKYINKSTKKFRTGGLLSKLGYVDDKLTYLTLFNPTMNLTWSVQIAENEFWVPDPKIKEKEELKQEKEEYIKEKLYKLYLGGKLKM